MCPSLLTHCQESPFFKVCQLLESFQCSKQSCRNTVKCTKHTLFSPTVAFKKDCKWVHKASTNMKPCLHNFHFKLHCKVLFKSHFCITWQWLGINITISTAVLSPFCTENSCINGNKFCLAKLVGSSWKFLGAPRILIISIIMQGLPANDIWFMLVYSEKSSFLSTGIQRPLDVCWMFKFSERILRFFVF